MRGAASLILLALAACDGPAVEPSNEELAANAPVEVQALPADESAATSSGELANGVNEPDAPDLGNRH